MLQQTKVAVEVLMVMLLGQLLQAMEVLELLLFVTLIHYQQQRLQLDLQQSPRLVGIGIINSQELVPLRFNHK